MTYHIKLENFACSKCQTCYIPFSNDLECPQCGFVTPNTDEYHSFIPEVLQSMTAHKLQYGRYVPDAWYEGSLSDSLQMLCFRFFMILEHTKPSNFEDFLQKNVKSMELQNEASQKLVTDVLAAVYGQYMIQDSPRLIKISKLREIKRFLLSLINR